MVSCVPLTLSAVITVVQGGVLKNREATGAFIVCGPPGFTALAIIKLGADARDM